MKDLRKLFSAGKENALSEPASAPANPSPPIQIRATQDFWTDLGYATWKLRKEVLDHETGEPKNDMRHLARNVEAIWDRLSEVGFAIQDHTGQLFDSGQSLEVLAFQPTQGIMREVVAETVRPTIYFMGQRILMGQVIVATPENPLSGQTQP
jgi:hypothetical protein